MALSARLFSCIAIGIMCCAHVSFGQTQTNVPAATASAPYKTQPKAVKPSKITKPLWSELKPEQQSALAPLQAEWLKMSEIQKRKWLEISKNYNKLSADDQTKLHARMTDWARLSPEQRAQARLNFSTAKALSPDEKQKKWDAYQALSPEEKTKLEAKAKANTPNSAALAAKPQNKVLPGKHTTAHNPKSSTATPVPTEK
jgi:Protein of unknown function (DUF3106)